MISRKQPKIILVWLLCSLHISHSNAIPLFDTVIQWAEKHQTALIVSAFCFYVGYSQAQLFTLKKEIKSNDAALVKAVAEFVIEEQRALQSQIDTNNTNHVRTSQNIIDAFNNASTQAVGDINRAFNDLENQQDTKLAYVTMMLLEAQQQAPHQVTNSRYLQKQITHQQRQLKKLTLQLSRQESVINQLHERLRALEQPANI